MKLDSYLDDLDEINHKLETSIDVLELLCGKVYHFPFQRYEYDIPGANVKVFVNTMQIYFILSVGTIPYK